MPIQTDTFMPFLLLCHMALIKCAKDSLIKSFQWLDHVFMIISEDDVDDAHRELLDCKTFVQHICGQNINL